MDGFTDEQLQALLRDPRFTPQDFALLSPEEQARARPLQQQITKGAQPDTLTSRLSGVMNTVRDVGTGAMKGVGDTSTALVDLVPGVTRGTTAVGNAIGGKMAELLYGKEAVTPPVPSARASGAFEPTNTAEKVGKVGEQIAEFAVPAGAARRSAIEGLVRLIPDSASPGAMRVLNKGAAYAGRAIGEAASAGGVSALHGGTDPVKTGLIAGGIPLATEAIAQSARALPVVGPLAAGVAAAHTLGPAWGLGMVGGLTMTNKVRSAVGHALDPEAIAAIQQALRNYAPAGLRMAVGASGEPDTPTTPSRLPVRR